MIIFLRQIYFEYNLCLIVKFFLVKYKNVFLFSSWFKVTMFLLQIITCFYTKHTVFVFIFLSWNPRAKLNFVRHVIVSHDKERHRMREMNKSLLDGEPRTWFHPKHFAPKKRLVGSLIFWSFWVASYGRCFESSWFILQN